MCFNPHPLRRADAIARVADGQLDTLVSILTRSEERMQYGMSVEDVLMVDGFNPHPLRRADAIFDAMLSLWKRAVSILTRSEERMQWGSVVYTKSII